MLDKGNMLEEKFYLTKQGVEKLKKEQNDLLALRKEMIAQEAPPAMHSEELETEFVAFKESRELLEQRLADLEYILNNVVLIKKPKSEEKKIVRLGSTVRLAGSETQNDYQVVGTIEADPELGKISDESPIGRALLGKQVGDEVKLGQGRVYKIVKVNY
ncbi:GreA/GreB family elongation factor [Candidatus Gribaldobacteria bacterium]|nr:GreA/GreB family elongation factor [Candidatus Gribaldobacteria bacterium]